MKHEEIKELNNNLSDMLSDRQLYEALEEMETAAHEAGYHDLSRTARELLTDYGYMLDYYERGASDPSRQEMFDHVYGESWTLLDTLVDRLEREESDTAYYTTQRMLAHRGLTVPKAINQLTAAQWRLRIAEGKAWQREADEADALAETTWQAIWTNYPATEADRTAIASLLADGEMPVWLRASMLSALTLSLLTAFDTAKALSLFGLTSETQPADLRMRAWVALLLVTVKYAYRIDHIPEMQERLRAIVDHPPMQDDTPLLLQLQAQLLQAPEAETATDKMKQEIEPEIRKGLREMQRRRSASPRDGSDGDSDMEINPEWASAFGNDRLKARIADYLKMQAEGTDVMMDAFGTLTRLPFFNSMWHWFAPFDIGEPWVQRLLRTSDPALLQLVRLVTRSRSFCDTDRQAHFMTLAHMNGTQRDAIVKALSEKGLGEVLDGMSSGAQDGDEKPKAPLVVSLHYLHDLYRFYRQAPHHEEWENPFDDRDLLDFGASPFLSPVTSSLEATQFVARYLFDKQRWPEAVAALQRWLAKDSSEEALQKIAYAACQKEVNDLTLAREALVTCNSLYPDKEWTLRYLAQFYIHNEEFAAAELLLEHACEIFPQDTDLLNKYASVLIGQGQFKQAFDPLYKADLIKEGQPRTLRNLAWCNLMLRRGDKAEQYISKLLERKPSRTDWLNGGHIALQNGNIPLALERYAHCLDRGRWTLEDFENAVYDDWTSLIDAGVRDVDITLAVDTLRRAAATDSTQKPPRKKKRR